MAPRSRPPRRSPAISRVATRTTRARHGRAGTVRTRPRPAGSPRAPTPDRRPPVRPSQRRRGPAPDRRRPSVCRAARRCSRRFAIVCELLCMSSPSTSMILVRRARASSSRACARSEPASTVRQVGLLRSLQSRRPKASVGGGTTPRQPFSGSVGNSSKARAPTRVSWVRPLCLMKAAMEISP
jgi:hypothetical protein